MPKIITLCLFTALAVAPMTSVSAQSEPPNPGRADQIVRQCLALLAESPESFSVGTCLALDRENSRNELSTLCAWAKQQGLLVEEPLLTVADCIRFLEGIEE